MTSDSFSTNRRPQRSVACNLSGLACMTALLATTVLAATPKPSTQPANRATSGVTIEVRGICVAAEPLGESDDALKPFPYSNMNGTTVAVLIQRPASGLIKFDENASKIDVFSDEQGKTLIAKKDSFFDKDFGAFPKISTDGKTAMIDIKANGVPGKDSRSIRIKGTLVFKAATKKQVFKQAGVALQKGTQISAGPLPLTISAAGKPEWGKDPLQVTFQRSNNFDSLASVRFLDGQGHDIKSSNGGSSSGKFMGATRYTQSYNLETKVSTATIEFTCWEDMAEIKIPVDLTATLGLGK